MIPFPLQPRFTEIVNESIRSQGLSLMVLRIDEVHAEISGNKIFKLDPFIDDLLLHKKEFIVTKGGPYSNHLLATASIAQLLNIRSVGIVRGERPNNLSPTITTCLQKNMQIIFVNRRDFDQINESNFRNYWQDNSPATFVAEGGYHPLGASGAAGIAAYIPDADFIVCAIGTATTFAGLCLGKKPNQKIIGIPVLKGLTDIPYRLQFLTGIEKIDGFIWPEFHFGGYSKKTTELIDFMNNFYNAYKIPTDFVYTAKMFYGLMQKVNEGFFPAKSKIVAIHSGGLQGNNSLPKGVLHY